MRILHFIPDIGVANGVMSVVMNYFSAMPEDIKFDIVYFKECEKDRRAQIEALGGRVYKINTPGIKSFLPGDIDALLKEHRGEYAAVHIHAPYMTCLIAPKARLYGIKKVAAHCHSTMFSLNGTNSRRNELLNKPTGLLASQLFACGQAAGEFWYGKNTDFTVLPNAIDCEKYRFSEDVRTAKRQELGIADKQLVIGHVGVTNPPLKNHSYLLKIFANIKKNYPNAVLLMAGAEATDELTKLRDELNLGDSAKFMGRRSDIPQLLSVMDMFIFPSLKEGLPVSVVEAQAAGLPVLMSDSVTDEVCVTKSMRRLSIGEDPAAWAKAADEFINADRQDTCDEMKAAGWDIHATAKRLIDFYRK